MCYELVYRAISNVLHFLTMLFYQTKLFLLNKLLTNKPKDLYEIFKFIENYLFNFLFLFRHLSQSYCNVMHYMDIIASDTTGPCLQGRSWGAVWLFPGGLKASQNVVRALKITAYRCVHVALSRTVRPSSSNRRGTRYLNSPKRSPPFTQRVVLPRCKALRQASEQLRLSERLAVKFLPQHEHLLII